MSHGGLGAREVRETGSRQPRAGGRAGARRDRLSAPRTAGGPGRRGRRRRRGERRASPERPGAAAPGSASHGPDRGLGQRKEIVRPYPCLFFLNNYDCWRGRRCYLCLLVAAAAAAAGGFLGREISAATAGASAVAGIINPLSALLAKRVPHSETW